MEKVNLEEKLARFTELWSTEHRPVADDEVHVLLLEPKTTVNTGSAGGERTREVEWL
jgi:hypothetical protein